MAAFTVVKTAEQCAKEAREANKRYAERMKALRNAEHSKPLTQGLGALLEKAGVK